MDARRRSAGAGLGLLAVVVIVGLLILRPRVPGPILPEPSRAPSLVAIAPSATTRPATAAPPSAEPRTTPSPTPVPVGTVDDDGTFALEIAVPKVVYLATEPIEPRARFRYLGPNETVTYGHASPAIYFTIQQLDGSAQMGGGADDLCELTTLRRDEPALVPFAKAGQIGLGFDLAWFRDPVLRLPAGTWRIGVSFEGTIPACEIGSETHRLGAFQDIVVR